MHGTISIKQETIVVNNTGFGQSQDCLAVIPEVRSTKHSCSAPLGQPLLLHQELTPRGMWKVEGHCVVSDGEPGAKKERYVLYRCTHSLYFSMFS